ncbi:MAG: hypothetical protein PWP27_398 [Clostridiales bacterium]|jgi:hypothetical protein|nr:hypothetical protein [Clostridiales bacterium]MDK2932588.1 hypothetical protein [Clostridiales bacterium]
MIGYVIAGIIALIVLSLISKVLKFAFKLVLFLIIVVFSVAVLKNFAPFLF